MVMPEWVSGNVYIRPNRLEKAGQKVEGHKHNFDHTTIFFRGSFRVKKISADGTEQEREFEAGTHCLIQAGVVHEITALEDDSEFWCIYSHRTPQGRIVQEFTGWEKAYQ